MKLFKFQILILAPLLFLASMSPFAAHAELRIDVTRGNLQPMPIAITQFRTDYPGLENVSGNISNVIRDNLRNSGLFDPLDPDIYLQSSQNLADGPEYPQWKTINAEALVSGSIQRSGNKIRVETRLWDIFNQKQLTGMAYTTQEDNWRRIAHIISDEIYKRITGESGYFDTRIVYVAESGPRGSRVKRLAIMDQDGANHQYLTNGNYLVLTPRFSPTSQTIAYMSYRNNKPRIYIYNLSTGQQEVLGDFPNMTFAPRFSPDGKSVIMSLAKAGNSDVYIMELDNRQTTRLTDHWGIDTSPSFAPDGTQIVFESDRGGSQQIYTMDSDGTNIKRITFGEGRYGNPVWSPRGDLIAFTKVYKGRFYIGVMRPDGSGERLITSAFHVEGTSWSPNGRYLVYFKERAVGPNGNERSVKLYTIDLTGFNERQLPTPLDGSDPAWSPLNP